jgi:hypothetical protein
MIVMMPNMPIIMNVRRRTRREIIVILVAQVVAMSIGAMLE